MALRRSVLLVLLLALCLPFASAAGTGAGPDGATIDVTVDASGYITSPSAIELHVSLAATDRDARVWVSDSPDRTAALAPAGRTVGSCAGSALHALADPGVFSCSVATILLRPGATYDWWLVYTPTDGGVPGAPSVAGPYTFTLAAPQGSVPPAQVSTLTKAAAPRLPSRKRFDGTASIRDTTLGAIVARTMKRAGRPVRRLRVACWTADDFASVLAASGQAAETPAYETLGVWFPDQSHWLHIGADSCARVQQLVDGRAPSGRTSAALATLLHETMHAYGIANEAEANCLAVQLTPLAARVAGLSPRRAAYVGALARENVRAGAPARYWNASRCRDGAAWDITSTSRRRRWPAADPRR